MAHSTPEPPHSGFKAQEKYGRAAVRGGMNHPQAVGDSPSSIEVNTLEKRGSRGKRGARGRMDGESSYCGLGNIDLVINNEMNL